MLTTKYKIIFQTLLGLARQFSCSSLCHCAPGGGGGEYSEIFYTYVGSGYFLGFKILNFNIFWGMKILWKFFWGHHKIDLYLGVISMHFWSFVRARYSSNGGCFLGLLKLQIFLGVLDISDTFWGE